MLEDPLENPKQKDDDMEDYGNISKVYEEVHGSLN